MKKLLLPLIALVIMAGPIAAETFFYANFDDGTATTFALINNTPESREIQPPGDPRVGGVPVIVPGKSVVRFPGWPTAGAGFSDYEVPDGFEAYVEVRQPNTQIVRIPPLTPVGDSAKFLLDMRGDDEYHTFVFIGAACQPGKIILYDSAAFGSDTAAVSPLQEIACGTFTSYALEFAEPSKIGFVQRSTIGSSSIDPDGRLFVFAVISRRTTGALVLVLPR